MLEVRPSSVRCWELNLVHPTPRLLPRLLAFLGYNPLPPASTLGDRLRRLRRSQGFSLKQVARYLGVDPASMSRWETQSKVPYPYIRRLLEAFLERFENADAAELAEMIKACESERYSCFDHPLITGTPETLGRLLFKRRKELNLSQTEAGRLMKAGRGAILNWETDSGIPDHRYMPGVLKFLGSVPFSHSPGPRLRLFRMALGIDAIQFERRFKVWRQTLHAWEKGKGPPDQRVMEEIGDLMATRFPMATFPRLEVADPVPSIYRPRRRG